MKRILLGFLLVGVVILYSGIANASCPTAHAIQHDNASIGLAGTTCATCIPRFWCLSTGTGNNNGTNVAWWQNYSAGIWWFNGDWGNPGINGCCGMWDAGYQSRTMFAAVEANFNEGSTAHYAYYDVEVDERNASQTSFFFTRAATWNMVDIPAFRVGTPFTRGATSSLTLRSWYTGAAGPAHYWVRLANGTTGTDLALGALCSPGGTGVCPAPIAGYQVRATTTACADGTCAIKVAAKPTSGLIANWALTVGATGTIAGQVVTFPVNAVTVTGMGASTALNAYLWIATQLRYADGFVSNYVSRNNLDPLSWSTTFGGEIDSISAKYVTASDVKVQWVGVAEGNVGGYNIYRSFSPSGTFERVNAKTIPTIGSGTTYAFKDRVISPAPRNAYYKIGIVRTETKDDLSQAVVAYASPKGPR